MRDREMFARINDYINGLTGPFDLKECCKAVGAPERRVKRLMARKGLVGVQHVIQGASWGNEPPRGHRTCKTILVPVQPSVPAAEPEVEVSMDEPLQGTPEQVAKDNGDAW